MDASSSFSSLHVGQSSEEVRATAGDGSGGVVVSQPGCGSEQGTATRETVCPQVNFVGVRLHILICYDEGNCEPDDVVEVGKGAFDSSRKLWYLERWLAGLFEEEISLEHHGKGKFIVEKSVQRQTDR